MRSIRKAVRGRILTGVRFRRRTLSDPFRRKPTSPLPMPAPSILVLLAHPSLQRSRVSRALIQAVTTLPHVTVHDLYARYPDYVIDVAAEQALAARAALIVWLHPLYWYGMPPLMKLWLDEVLTPGWAYGPGGHQLRGKALWLALSAGGSEESYSPQGYNHYPLDAFLPPYEQTAALCGLRFLPPFVLYGAHQVSDAALRAHTDRWVQRLESYPDWSELADTGNGPSQAVPQHDRPQGA